jgi:hypothetical protein
MSADEANVPPTAPCDTDAARMDNATRMLFSASKEAFLKQETKHKGAKERKKRRQTTGSTDGGQNFKRRSLMSASARQKNHYSESGPYSDQPLCGQFFTDRIDRRNRSGI